MIFLQQQISPEKFAQESGGPGASALKIFLQIIKHMAVGWELRTEDNYGT